MRESAERVAVDRSCRRRRRAVPGHVGRLLVLVGTLLAGSASVGAVEVLDPQWGFDGKVRPHRFNLLTVTVDNPAPVPAEVDLVLQKWGGSGRVDAPLIEQKIYLAPGTRRSVQFYPYITHDWSQWRLNWDRQSLDLPQPRSSRRGARILLDASEAIVESRGSLRRFSDAQFPPFVTALDTLQAVVLDHAPRWDEPRRTAFLDWIYRGGAVFLLKDANGRQPEFPASMNILNTPLDVSSYGSGVIRKLDIGRNQLSQEQARALWHLLPNALSTAQQLMPGEPSPTAASDDDEDDDAKLDFSFSEGGSSLTSGSFFDELKQMTKPDHNWLLLHFMFWIYILLIFPGCFLIGLNRNDFRVVYLCLGGIVLVFSLAFGLVGQRGYGETTTVNSVAIVQPLPDGYLDIAQWSNAFVTSGALYDIHHSGSGALYSTCQDTEYVNGAIQNGSAALFQVDIPPYSSREFAHRIKTPGTLPKVQIKQVVADDTGLRELTLSLDANFPKTDEIYLLYQDRFHTAARHGDEITLRSNVGAVPAFLRVEQQSQYDPRFRYSPPDRTPESRFRDLILPLATRSLNIRSMADAQSVRWNSEHVRLMYFADLLPELAVDSPQFPTQKGKALYCIDLPFAGPSP